MMRTLAVFLVLAAPTVVNAQATTVFRGVPEVKVTESGTLGLWQAVPRGSTAELERIVRDYVRELRVASLAPERALKRVGGGGLVDGHAHRRPRNAPHCAYPPRWLSDRHERPSPPPASC